MSIHAEVLTPDATSAYGYVLHLRATHVTLRIVNSQDVMQTMVQGMEVQLSISSSAGCYTALGRIQSIKQETLVITLSTAFLCEQHRRRLRISCAWPAMLRSVHTGETTCAWKQAQVVDLSTEGIGVKIRQVRLVEHWEVRIVVQEEYRHKDESRARQYDDLGSHFDNKPKPIILQVKANLKHHQECVDGIRLGLAFTSVTSQDEAIITHLLEIASASNANSELPQ
jgi:hypothetical protein